jgi:hypothetical protein
LLDIRTYSRAGGSVIGTSSPITPTLVSHRIKKLTRPRVPPGVEPFVSLRATIVELAVNSSALG